MRPMALIDTLDRLMAVEGGPPAFVWGPPGIGKSSIVAEVAEKHKRPLVDIRAVLLDPVDLRGLPHINGDGRTHWSPPSFLPYEPDSRAVIFLDELPQAVPLMQSACLQLTLDRKIGDYKLPPGCTIIAAGNRQTDRAGAHRLITPLLNRFLHLEMELHADDWRAWALRTGIDHRVTSFIAFKPGALFAFDPKSADNAFPTPRSWAFVSRVIANLTEQQMHPVVSGCVGAGAAAEFCGFAKIFKELPDPGQILRDPTGSAVPIEPAILHALCGALVQKIKSDGTLLDAFATYVTRIQPEFTVLAMRDGLYVNETLMKTPAAAAWLRNNKHLIVGD